MKTLTDEMNGWRALAQDNPQAPGFRALVAWHDAAVKALRHYATLRYSSSHYPDTFLQSRAEAVLAELDKEIFEPEDGALWEQIAKGDLGYVAALMRARRDK